MPRFIDDDLRQHLADGVVMIVGSTSPSGVPCASRGFGATPFGDDTLEVYLDIEDTTAAENLATTGRIAVTTGHQRTFRSIQFKGSASAPMPASALQREAAIGHLRRFWDRIQVDDNLAREAVEQGTPRGFLVCVMTIEMAFDQTPGPRAGEAITGSVR